MIIGIGTDLVKIERLNSSLEKLGDKFAKRILSPQEFSEYSESSFPVNYIAKRFAAKEATGKALGTGIGQGVSWQHIVIEHDDIGAPLLKLHGRAAELAGLKGVKSTHISITDEKDYAIAFVVLSGT